MDECFDYVRGIVPATESYFQIPVVIIPQWNYSWIDPIRIRTIPAAQQQALAWGNFTPSAAVTTTVFGPVSWNSNENGWGGFTLRQRIALADLLEGGPISGNVIVTLQFFTGTTGNLINGWIGNWTGTNQDFDGNQVQLTWSGSTSVALGTTAFDSDPIAFTYAPGANGIIVSFAVTGTVNATLANIGFHTNTDLYYLAGDHAADTAFSGTKEQTTAVESVVKVVMQS